MDNEGNFDVIVLGTGLTESITAAALAKAGFKVAHLDRNDYYGGGEASLSLDEYINWATQNKDSNESTSISLSSTDALPNSRQYSISLSPSVIPAAGPLITSLVESGVSRYGGFRLVEYISVYSAAENKVKTVPGSKEDIFKDKAISLLDKRRLMRFLAFASTDVDFEERPELQGANANLPFVELLKTTFSLNQEMAETITYALSHCVLPSDKALPALRRLRRYLRSTGRYGHSPFLIGHYGSSGEIAQGFCRTAAVAGGVYILGKEVTSMTRKRTTDETQPTPMYTLTLSDFPEPITCDLIISSESRLPATSIGDIEDVRRIPSVFPDAGEEAPRAVARGICIIDQPLSFATRQEPSSSEGEDHDPESPLPVDTGILIFPPSSLDAGIASAVTVLVVGEGTLSVPKGKWIIYLSTPISTNPSVSPEQILKPYLDLMLSFSATSSSTEPIVPLFTSFYLHTIPPPTIPSSTKESTSSSSPTILIPPSPANLPLPDPGDAAALNAEATFWEAVKVLQKFRISRKNTSDETGEEVNVEVERFWPPVPNEEDDDEE